MTHIFELIHQIAPHGFPFLIILQGGITIHPKKK